MPRTLCEYVSSLTTRYMRPAFQAQAIPDAFTLRTTSCFKLFRSTTPGYASLQSSMILKTSRACAYISRQQSSSLDVHNCPSGTTNRDVLSKHSKGTVGCAQHPISLFTRCKNVRTIYGSRRTEILRYASLLKLLLAQHSHVHVLFLCRHALPSLSTLSGILVSCPGVGFVSRWSYI